MVLVDRDQEVADQVLQWIITRHKPELVIVASVLVGGYAGRILNQNGIPLSNRPSSKLPVSVVAHTGRKLREPKWAGAVLRLPEGAGVGHNRLTVSLA